MKVIFSHGKESGPQGSKIQYLSSIAEGLGFSVDSIDYRESFDTCWRVERLLEILEKEEEPFVLVGSSMGAYVANLAATQKLPLALFLMAPAFYVDSDEYAEKDPAAPQCPISIVHGWNDDIVPFDNALRFAKKYQTQLHGLDGDHGLNSVLKNVGDLFQLFLIDVIESQKVIAGVS